MAFLTSPPCLADSTVVFNELMYHPEREEARREWVELHNQMAVDMDISGWSLDGGIRFAFPEGTIIPGGGFLIVAVDPATLAEAAIPCPVLGPFIGRLDNSGERIEIRNRDGRVMDDVRYRDGGAWPVEADGSGLTLAKRDPDFSSGPARNWAASAQIGGTPGDHNFPSTSGPNRYPTGISAYWNFDQTSGQLLDLVGGNTGSTGAGAIRVAGIIGSGAVDFDNSIDAFVAVGTGVGDSYTMTDGIAVEALVKSTWSLSPDDPDTIFRKEDGPWRISLAFQADGITSNRDVPIDPPEQPVISFGINVGGTYGELDMPLDGLEGRPSIASLKDGQAHHVVATYNAASGLKAIYFDGQLAFSHRFPAGTLMASGGTTTAYIGNMSGRRQPFSGTIDEVAIYRRSLSADEVARHWENVQAGIDYFSIAPVEESRVLVAFNEYAAPTAGDFWAEITSGGAEPASLAGATIVLAGANVPPYQIPAASLPPEGLPPGGFLVVSERELGFRPVRGQKLFLYGPGMRTVLAGLLVEAELAGRHPEATGMWFRPARPTPGAPNEFLFRDEIVVNEILYHPRPIREGATSRRSTEAWIELFNRSDHAVDLTGWRLRDAVDFDFEAGTVLGSGEYIVVASDRDALGAMHPGIRIVGNFTKRLSRKDDDIRLEDPYGNPADEVHYHDGGRWPGYADGGGSSLELRDPYADNSRAEAWAPSDERAKSEWKTYSYSGVATANFGPTQWNELVIGLLGAGEALIDDLSVVESPSGAATQFLQNGSFEGGAQSWRFLGTHRHSAVVPNPDGAGSVLHLVATGPTEHMHNHIETTFAGGRRVTNGREYQISFRAKWLAGSEQLNTRLYFNRLPRTTLLDVPARSGTPGAPNSVLEENIGPTFEGLELGPVAPQAGEDVSARIRVADPDGVASVTLWWNPGGSGWRSVPMVLSGGDLHEGTIPGQASATIVQLYVEAVDSRGARATYPAGGRDSRALFKVQDGQSQLGKLHNLRIIMLPAEADFLHLATNVMSNEWLPCTVVYDERTPYYDVGVRLKGSERGRPVAGRVGFHLKFDPDRRFRGVHGTVHVDRSGGWSYGGPNGHDEIVIKHIVNHAGGIPGMHDDLIRVIAPRSAQNGTAILMMAAFSDVFLDGQWEDGSDGTQYKLELIYYPTTTVDGNPQSLKLPQPDNVMGTDLTNLGDDKELYRWTFLIRNNRVLDDYTGLVALCKAFALPTAQLDAGTRAIMDVDQWMRTFTIISLCGITDTYTQGNNHNNTFYRRPTDGKMLAFPWDMDFSWVRSTSSPLYGDQNLSRVIALPHNKRLFYGHLLDIIDTTYNREYMARWVSHYGSLVGADYTNLLSYMDARRNFVRSSIPAKVAFVVTTNSGADFSVSATDATLEGNGWYDVRTIIVAAREDPLDPTWTTETRWRARVDLDFGPNVLDLLAIDYQGRIVGTDRITVTSSVGFPAPRIASVLPERAFPGSWVSLGGTSFQAGAKVFFGSAQASEVVRESETSLRARVPALEAGAVPLVIENTDGRRSQAVEFGVLETGRFIRGDANLDGTVDVSDPLRVLLHLFGGMPLECEDAGDANDDELLNLTDVLSILGYLFQQGPPPPSPFPDPGTDPGAEGPLGCG